MVGSEVDMRTDTTPTELMMLVEAEHYKEARRLTKHFIEALPIYEPEHQSLIHWSVAVLTMIFYPTELMSARQSLELAVKYATPTLKASAFNKLALIALEQNALLEADSFLNAGMKCLEGRPNSDEELDLLTTRALEQLKRNSVNEALDSVELLISSYNSMEVKKPKQALTIARTISQVERQRSNFSVARNAELAAYKLAVDLQSADSVEFALLCRGLSNSEFAERNFANAIDVLQQGYTVYGNRVGFMQGLGKWIAFELAGKLCALQRLEEVSCLCQRILRFERLTEQFDLTDSVLRMVEVQPIPLVAFSSFRESRRN